MWGTDFQAKPFGGSQPQRPSGVDPRCTGEEGDGGTWVGLESRFTRSWAGWGHNGVWGRGWCFDEPETTRQESRVERGVTEGEQTLGAQAFIRRGLGGVVETDHKPNPKKEPLIPLQGGFDLSSKMTFPRTIPRGGSGCQSEGVPPTSLRPSPQSPCPIPHPTPLFTELFVLFWNLSLTSRTEGQGLQWRPGEIVAHTPQLRAPC